MVTDYRNEGTFRIALPEANGTHSFEAATEAGAFSGLSDVNMSLPGTQSVASWGMN